MSPCAAWSYFTRHPQAQMSHPIRYPPQRQSGRRFAFILLGIWKRNSCSLIICSHSGSYLPCVKAEKRTSRVALPVDPSRKNRSQKGLWQTQVATQLTSCPKERRDQAQTFPTDIHAFKCEHMHTFKCMQANIKLTSLSPY